ncbi:LysR family transcriptional regulator [Lacrimispora sp.]|uniref:LysR family transcriptional regulator n=1 Tax=Lacrimispora sp. TaxID=2719234 RepID=UPI0029E730AF|nr:hypothetical protein [Lacrimispora sp.]
MIEIRNLRTLVKIAELGSYTKAAQALGYAQSTLTFQVGAIESYYNCPVFDRTGKVLKLTAFGEQLLEHTNSVLQEYDALEQLGRSDAAPRGCLRIGAPESLTLYRLHPLIMAYKSAYPQVEVRMINSPCEMLLKDLSAGQLDISFVLQPECMDPNLCTELLSQERMCLIAPAGHTQQDFLPEPGQMVLYTEKECSYRQEFDRYLQRHHTVPANILETSSVEAIKKYVSSGLGVSYLPYYSVKKESESKSLRTKFIQTDLTFFTQIVYHKKKWISPAIKALIALSREYGRKWSDC